MATKPRRAILDLRGLALHAYYSNRNHAITVTGSKGEPVPSAEHMVNQFIDIYLLPILREYQPIEIIAAMEGANGNARRRRLFPDYKNKPEQDADDAVASANKSEGLETIARLLMHLGCTLVRTPTVEADDTIAYLCERLQGHKRVYSRDKDLLALHAPDTEIYISDYHSGLSEHRTSFEGIDLTEQPTSMVTMYKSLVGDTSDNYKGIPGMGPKTMAKLVGEVDWDGMEQLVEIVETENWEWLKSAAEGSKLLTKLYENRVDWRTCWVLAKLHPEWCEETFLGKAVRPTWAKRLPQRENILKTLNSVGLGDRIEDFEQYGVSTFLMDRKWLEDNRDKLEEEMKLMLESPLVAFDYESYDSLNNPKYKEARKGFVDVLSQRITGASFAYGPNLNRSFYIPTNHSDTDNCDPRDIRMLLEHVSGQKVLAHNSVFEMTLSKTNLDYEFTKLNPPVDTGDLASHVDEEGEKGLKLLSKKWLNYDQITYREVIGDHTDMRDLSGEEVMDYGADDSLVTAHLGALFQIILECEQTLKFASDVERYFSYATTPSFIAGVPIDWEKLEVLREEDRITGNEAEANLRKLLQERCSQVNEDGFKTIWPEIRKFQEASARHRANKKGKEVDKDQIAEKKAQKEQIVRDGCRYRPWGPRPANLSQRTLSATSRSIGLASMRANKGVSVVEWADSMWQQAADQGVELDETQQRFLQALRPAAEATGKGMLAEADLSHPDVAALLELVRELMARDPEQWVGTELNVGSPDQMAMLFYGMMGLPILIRNEVDDESARGQFALEGAPSTNALAMETWLVELPEDDWRREAIDLISTIRACSQRESLYYSKWPLWASPVDGRLHPQFKNCGTETRRPSGNSPNFLQISKHKDGGRLRSVVLPQSADRPGAEPEVIVSIDWSQEEIRLAAEVSRDPGLMACYMGENRKDVHTNTSVGIMNTLLRRDPEIRALAESSSVGGPWTYDTYVAVRKDSSLPIHKRADNVRSKLGKPTVFTLLYKGGPYGLARKLVIPVSLGEAIFNEFMKTYPGVGKRQEEVCRMGRKHGFVKTIFGNRRHCPLILSKDKRLASAIERQIVNFEMQGAAADITKMTCKEWVLRDVPGRTGATLMAFVYDEIVASVPISKVYEYVHLMCEIMEITLPSGIVLEAEVSLGPSWGEQIELQGNHSEENINKAIEEALHGKQE